MRNRKETVRILSRAGHEESCLNYPRPRGKAKYERDTDSDEYREGKVKSTPDRGVKESLKPCAYDRSEPLCGVTACLLHNEPTSCSRAARLSAWRHGAEAKASLKRAASRAGQTRNLVIYPWPG